MDKKFNPEKLAMLNNPERLKNTSPDYIWAKLNMKRCDVITDIGAGTGIFTKAFLTLAGGGKAYAADISPVMVGWMKENLSVDTGEVVPLLMEETSVPLDDDSVDLVLMINLYHELDQPEVSLKEALRILRSDGRICIVDWKKEETESGPPLKIRISREDIAEAVGIAGFRSVQSDDGLPDHSLVWAAK